MVNLATLFFFERALLPFYSSYKAQTYFSIVLFIILAAALCAILASLAYVLSLSPLQDSEKKSEYECGFEPFDNATRLPFDVHFYLVGILFLIFDVEVALFFPWVLSLRLSGWFGFYLIVAFIIVLTVGFLYEWKRGALIWPSRQSELPYVPANGRITAVKLSFVPTVFLTETSTYGTQFFGDLLPEIFLITAISVILVALSYGLGQHQNKRFLALSALKALSQALLFTALLYVVQLFTTGSIIIFEGYIALTSYTCFIKLLTTLCCWFILINSESYIKQQLNDLLEYAVIMSLATLLILLLISAVHFVAAFIALVGFSLNLYVLIFSDAATAAVREGGVKYFYLSTLSSGILLYGIFLFYFISQTGQFFEINQIFSTDFERTASSTVLVKVAIAFVLVGLFFKLSAFPGHLWAADVYEGSPDPITAFFMLPVKVATLAFVLNLLITALEPIASVWQPLILASSFLSLLWGCFAALSERKTKRFLAFASINQIGFILMGFASASFEGYRASVFYIIIYAIINVVFLIVFLHTKRNDGYSIIYLTDFRGFGHRYPAYSWSLAIALLSIAGIPPLAGFFGKYYLLLHAQEQGLYTIVIAALFTSLISTYYYLRVIKIIWFENSGNPNTTTCHLSQLKSTVIHTAEWSLWGFILYVSGVLQIIDLLITSATILP